MGSKVSGGEGPNEDVKVVDRRIFDSEGNLRAEDEAPSAEPEKASEPDPSVPPRQAAREGLAEAEPVSFTAFVMSFAVNALIALGAFPHQANQQPEVDLVGARQLIDILAMLREKTEGNRTPEETKALDTNLYELRMRFVEASKAG